MIWWSESWTEGLTQIFEAVLENKPFIMNVYHSVNHEKIESFLYKLTYQLIADVVEEKCSRDHLPETDKQFIADFYKYGFVGIMLDWIDRGMKEDYQKIVDLLAVTLHGNIANSIRNFAIKKIWAIERILWGVSQTPIGFFTKKVK